MSTMSPGRVGPALVFAVALTGRMVFSMDADPRPTTQSTPAAPSTPVTYTEEQAGRGAGVFTTVCVECHVRKDMSNADFRVKWNGRTAFDLFELIRTTMPDGSPGSLERAQYVDVVAYIAKLNGVTAGTAALADDDTAMKKQTLPLPPQHQ